MSAPHLAFADAPLPAKALTVAPDATTRDAIATLMATHGHTLTVEQRAAVRGWLGRTA